MKSKILWGCILTLSVMVLGCIEPPSSYSYKIDVEAVYMHTTDHYSILYFENKESKELTSLNFYQRFNDKHIKIIADVEEGKNNWVSVTGRKERGNNYNDKVEIHIHSIDDINTAGWDRGKFGTGKTSRIKI